MNKQDLQTLYRQIKQRKSGSGQNAEVFPTREVRKCGTCGKTVWRPGRDK
ncbi:hypothetical protein [Sporolactobacillus putidus]|uniref:Uncharacterized protein n=1 Tax=Sporolactobacillus putidus TaxID=492735 RepID=A0A917RYT6_9BACL|nr:hypothetical protein [Sporolactobacillus putidus]GGL45594.1 hypothetical protein GCM10007968_07150 [Sporolactobacillus putidus]